MLLVVKSCSIPSTYFRVTAHLMHHDEPVTLDWVVECRYQQNVGDAVGARAFVVPYVFGVATRDGGMVLMVAPNACGQQKEVRDNLPFFMWGDKAGDFGFFTAYVTREAFNNPSTQIKVLDVDIRPSDRAEHDRWAATAPKNVVPDYPDPFRQDMRGEGAICLGLVEVAIPASFADEFHRLQPAGGPLYWIAPRELGTSIAYAQHSFVNNYTPLVDGLGLDAMKAEWNLRVFPFSDRSAFRHIFADVDSVDVAITQHLRVDFERGGMMSCGAFRLQTRPYRLTVFDFPDGSSLPIAVIASSNTSVIRRIETLFLKTSIGFRIERGLENSP